MALQMTSAGLFGIGPQTGLGSAASSFYWFPLVNCDFGPLEGQDNLPWEIGGKALPRGRFKTGIVFGGNVDIVPRLDYNIGWLLYAAVGDHSQHDDQTISQVIAGTGSNTGVTTYQFYFDSSDEFAIKYLTAHKLLPHDTDASKVGEIAEDCRVTALTITATPAAVVTMRFGLLGRATATTVWDVNPGWSATYDQEDTFMVTSCTGDVQIEGVSYDTGAVTITLANNVLPPARARKIGSGHPIDFPVLSRALTIATTCYVSDYELYMDTFSEATGDRGWSCTPYSGDFDITLQSAAEIAGAASTAYYQMRIRTTQNNVNFMVRPIVLVPNQPVVFQLIGTVQAPSSGHPFDIYFQTGDSTGFTWPT